MKISFPSESEVAIFSEFSLASGGLNSPRKLCLWPPIATAPLKTPGIVSLATECNSHGTDLGLVGDISPLLILVERSDGIPPPSFGPLDGSSEAGSPLRWASAARAPTRTFRNCSAVRNCSAATLSPSAAADRGEPISMSSICLPAAKSPDVQMSKIFDI